MSRLTVSELLLEKRGLSPEIAVQIGRLLNTTPESWLRMQEAPTVFDDGDLSDGSVACRARSER